MNEKKERKASYRFTIIDKVVYNNSLKINTGKYSVGTEAFDAADHIYKNYVKNTHHQIYFLYNINSGRDIKDNYGKGYQTLRNIHTTLSWLFRKDSGFDHQPSHVKAYLENFLIQDKYRSEQIAKTFENFMSCILPYAEDKFKDFNYKYNTKTGKFEVKLKGTLEKIIGNFINVKNQDLSSNETRRILTKLRKRSAVIVGGIILTIVIVSLTLQKTRNIENAVSKPQKVTEQRKDGIRPNPCTFTPNDQKQQILILPFKHIKKDEFRDDISFLIKARYDSLSQVDSLDLDIRLCPNLKYFSQENSGYQQLKKKHNANILVYGFYEEEDTQKLSKDPINLNFIGEYYDKVPNIYPGLTNKSYGNFKSAASKDINKGHQQELLDYVIYYNAMAMAIKEKKYLKAIHLSDYLLLMVPKMVIRSVLINRISSFQSLYYDYGAMKEAAEFINLKNHEVDIQKGYESYYSNLHNYLGKMYLYFGKNKRARFHLKAAMFLNLSELEPIDLIEANRRLGYHKENIALLKCLINSQYKKYSEDNIYAFRYLSAVIKKEIGQENEFKKDSIQISKERIAKSKKLVPVDYNFSILYQNLRNKRLDQFVFGNRNPDFKIETIFDSRQQKLIKNKAYTAFLLSEEYSKYRFPSNSIAFTDHSNSDGGDIGLQVFNFEREKNLWKEIYDLDKGYKDFAETKSFRFYKLKTGIAVVK